MLQSSTSVIWVKPIMESWRVNAYAVVDNITYPLLFKIFKPRPRLQAGDVYKTKPELAVEILQELEKWKFRS